MPGAQLGYEFGTVFCCVDGEGARDYEEGLREFADGELFSGTLDEIKGELIRKEMTIETT